MGERECLEGEGLKSWALEAKEKEARVDHGKRTEIPVKKLFNTFLMSLLLLELVLFLMLRYLYVILMWLCEFPRSLERVIIPLCVKYNFISL